MFDELRKDMDIAGVHIKNFLNFTEEEKRLVLDWRNSEMVRNGMYGNEVIGWEAHVAFIDALASDDSKLYYLAFIGDVPVGVVYFTGISRKHRRGVYGIYLRPDRTYPPDTGERMRNVVFELAFERMGFNTLNSEVLSDNKAAYIYNLKGGFKKEGVLRGYISRGAKTLDVVLFGMLKEEYQKLKSV